MVRFRPSAIRSSSGCQGRSPRSSDDEYNEFLLNGKNSPKMKFGDSGMLIFV